MERITAGQAFGKGGSKATKLVEINFRHPIIKSLKDQVDGLDEDADNQTLKDYAQMLYDVALVNSGFTINGDMVSAFQARMNRVISAGLDVDSSATVDALPEFADDEEEEEMDLDEDDEEEEEEEEASSGHDEL